MPLARPGNRDCSWRHRNSGARAWCQHVPCDRFGPFAARRSVMSRGETGERRLGLGARWIVAALLIAPVASAAVQATGPRDPMRRPGDTFRITVAVHPETSREF